MGTHNLNARNLVFSVSVMKAVTINQYGSTEILHYKDVKKPHLNAKDVLIEIYSTSINPVDWKIRKGELKIFTGFNFPKRLGADFAGIVKTVGAKAEGFKPGDKVFGFVNPLKGGAYAEYISVNSSLVSETPSNLEINQAGVIPLAGLTAIQGLRLGKIKKDSKILINGASGGVGTFATQIAKLSSSKVTGVCSSRNIDLVKSLGATKVIDYTRQDFIELSDQYDIIFDVVGSKSYYDCQHILNTNGIYVSTLPKIKNLMAIAQTFWLSSKKAKLVVVRQNLKDLKLLSKWIENQEIQPIIDRSYLLEQIKEAHAYSEKGRAKGKILLRVK